MKRPLRLFSMLLISIPLVWDVGIAQDTPAPGYGNFDDPLKHSKVTIIDQISVPAEEMGVLDELTVREGMLVEKGQLLGVIDKKDAELALDIAKYEYAAALKTSENTLSIEAAAKSYDVAIAEYEASLEANERRKGTVTQTEVRRKKLQADRAKMQAELAAEELKIARFDARAKYAALQRAEASLARREVRSRINGVVVKVNKHAGEWVQPGEVILRVVRMDRLRVEGDINGKKYARHEVLGRPVTILVKLTGGGVERLEGKIVYASSIIESNEYTIRAEILNRKLNDRWLITPGLDAEIALGKDAGLDLQFSQSKP